MKLLFNQRVACVRGAEIKKYLMPPLTHMRWSRIPVGTVLAAVCSSQRIMYNVPRTLVAKGEVWRERSGEVRIRATFPASFLSNFSTKFHLNSLNFYNFQTNFAQYMSSNFRTSVHQGKGLLLKFYSNFRTSVHFSSATEEGRGGL